MPGARTKDCLPCAYSYKKKWGTSSGRDDVRQNLVCADFCMFCTI